MAIDIVKTKSRKKTVNLKQFNNTPPPNPEKSLEEKIEKKFSNLPQIARKQKIKMMWLTVIFFTTIIIVVWFYLLGKGVVFKAQTNNHENNIIDINNATENIIESFGELKQNVNKQINELSDFGKKIESVASKNKLVDDLKKNLELIISDKNTTKTVSESKNIILTNPLPNSYTNNPLKILGRGKLDDSKFKILLKDENDKILIEADGTTTENKIMTPFEMEINYPNPTTSSGTLQIFTENNEKDLISINLNFIKDLENWQILDSEEYEFEIKYPNKWEAKQEKTNLIKLSKIDSDENIEITILKNSNITNHVAEFKSNNYIYTNETYKQINGYEAFFGDGMLENNAIRHTIISKENTIFNIILSKFSETTLDEFQQIISTFRLKKPDYKLWNEFEDTTQEITFKYPARLKILDDVGQIRFAGSGSDDFSFYFFTIEPQIDNLDKWIEKSSVNTEEKITKNEDKEFGQVPSGVYYESVSTNNLDEINEEDVENDEEIKNESSIGYIFNHYGTTYSLRTNKNNFSNTFNNILNTIKFKTAPMEINEDGDL